MPIYEVIIWFLGYAFFVFFSAMAINGLFITTRGSRQTLPNGQSAPVNDMIFYPLYELITREKGKNAIYYSGSELRKLHRIIVRKMPLPHADEILEDALKFNNGRSSDALKLWTENTVDYLDDQEIKMETALFVPEKIEGPDLSDKRYGTIRLYKEYPVYVLPRIIRKPLIECIKCMASIWGTLIYWPAVLLLFHFQFRWEMVPIWIVFCFSLSYVNTFLYHKAS